MEIKKLFYSNNTNSSQEAGAETGPVDGNTAVALQNVPSVADQYPIATAGPTFFTGLGLRIPGNVGDGAALLILAELISSRLANDNDASKASSRGFQRSAKLDEMLRNIEEMTSLKDDIAALSAQRDEIAAAQSALAVDLDALQARRTELLNLIAELSGEPGSEDQIAAAKLELARIASESGELRIKINDLDSEMDNIDAQSASKSEVLAEAQAFEAVLLSELQRLSSSHLTEMERHRGSVTELAIEDREQYRLLVEERVRELEIRDQFLLNDVVEVLRREGEAGSVDATAFATTNSVNGRIQLPL